MSSFFGFSVPAGTLREKYRKTLFPDGKLFDLVDVF